MDHSVDTMTSKLSFLTGVPDSLSLQQLKKKRLFLRFQVPSFMHSTFQRSVHCHRRFKWCMTQSRHSPYLSGMDICSVRGSDGKDAPVCAIVPFFIPSHISLKVAFSYCY